MEESKRRAEPSRGAPSESPPTSKCREGGGGKQMPDHFRLEQNFPSFYCTLQQQSNERRYQYKELKTSHFFPFLMNK